MRRAAWRSDASVTGMAKRMKKGAMLMAMVERML